MQNASLNDLVLYLLLLTNLLILVLILAGVGCLVVRGVRGRRGGGLARELAEERQEVRQVMRARSAAGSVEVDG